MSTMCPRLPGPLVFALHISALSTPRISEAISFLVYPFSIKYVYIYIYFSIPTKSSSFSIHVG